jgi:hypothetical protein
MYMAVSLTMTCDWIDAGHSSVNMTKKFTRLLDDLMSRDEQKLVG